MNELDLPGSDVDAALAGGSPALLRLELLVDDPESVAALSALPPGRERNRHALTALRIGILALGQARGRVDAEAVRHEGERLIRELETRLGDHQRQIEGRLGQTLREYFDPGDGRFTERVERLVRQDGELERLMRGQVESAQALLSETLACHVGAGSPIMALLAPEEGNRFLAALGGAVDGALQAQNAQVLREFSLDNPEGALARLLRELADRHGALTQGLAERIDEVVEEFSLDKENSALSRLVSRVEQAQRRISDEFSLDNDASALARMRRELGRVLDEHRAAAQSFQQEVTAALQAMQARREESLRSTTHGRDFEQAGFAFVAALCAKAGDVADDVGQTVGALPRCKVGDALVTLGPDCAAAGARIAIEFKESGSYTLSATLAELDEAMKNREAQVGLFVHSKRSAPAGLEPVARYGDKVVVLWDAQDEASDAYLRAGLILAKAIAVRAHAADEAIAADLKLMEAAAGEIARQTALLEDVSSWSGTIHSNAEKIAKRIERVRAALDEQTEVLAAQLARLKTPA